MPVLKQGFEVGDDAQRLFTVRVEKGARYAIDLFLITEGAPRLHVNAPMNLTWDGFSGGIFEPPAGPVHYHGYGYATDGGEVVFAGGSETTATFLEGCYVEVREIG